MVADPATNAGKRVILLEQFESFKVFAFIDECNVALDADMGRAGGFAGGGTAFADGKRARNGLGVFFINGFSKRQAPVLFVRHLDGADLGAFPATGTFGKIHIPGFLADFCPEIARLPFQCQNFRSGFQLDVQMPADLDQFGRDDSHGTVIGGKRFVQLGHEAADGSGLFQQINVIAGIGKINGRLHAGDAGTDHHGRADGFWFLFTYGRCGILIHAILLKIKFRE
jgi:hypothetical protein